MKMNPINFKGTFCIDRESLITDSAIKLADRKDQYQLDIYRGNYRNPNDLFVHSPDKNDEKLEKFLSKLKIKFKKVNENDSLNAMNIIARMILSHQADSSGCTLRRTDVKKLDDELKKDADRYIGINGINGSQIRYNRFKNYLRTNQQIEAPLVYLEKTGEGKISTHVYDGRHRISVLRDMGMSHIPIAMTEESASLAREIGLI